MLRKVLIILTLLAAICILVGPWTIFPACPAMEDGRYMKCHWALEAVKAPAIILIVVAVLEWFAGSRQARRSLSLVGAVTALTVILLTLVFIGGCMKPEMACQSRAFPAVNILAVVALLAQVVGIFYQPIEPSEHE